MPSLAGAGALLVVVLGGLLQDLDGVAEVRARQVLERLLVEALADLDQLRRHPRLADAGDVGRQEALAPLSLDLRPQHLDRVQDAGGGRQEQQLAAQLLEELGDLPAEVRAVVVEDDDGAAQVVPLRHHLEEGVHHLLVRRRRQPGEEPPAGQSPYDRDVVPLLLAELNLLSSL